MVGRKVCKMIESQNWQHLMHRLLDYPNCRPKFENEVCPVMFWLRDTGQYILLQPKHQLRQLIRCCSKYKAHKKYHRTNYVGPNTTNGTTIWRKHGPLKVSGNKKRPTFIYIFWNRQRTSSNTLSPERMGLEYHWKHNPGQNWRWNIYNTLGYTHFLSDWS